jgi:hypothetical protein
MSKSSRLERSLAAMMDGPYVANGAPLSFKRVRVLAIIVHAAASDADTAS